MTETRPRGSATQTKATTGRRLMFGAVLIAALGVCAAAVRIAAQASGAAASSSSREDQSTPTAAESTPHLIKDINPGVASSTPEMFVAFEDAVYFRANDGAHGLELWRTDGTSQGTTLVADLFPGRSNGVPGNLSVVAGKLFFHAFTEATGSKVFVSDGTAQGTRLLVDTFPGAPSGPDGPPLPSGFTTFGSNALFAATDRKLGYELWITDGTRAGTRLVKDIHPGGQWSVPLGITTLDTKAFFAADDSFIANSDGTPTYDRELFVTDGTEAGTTRLLDINPGPQPSTPVFLTLFANRLLFRADDGVHGSELWTSDGTAEGTMMLHDINLQGSSSPMPPTVVGDRVFFSADDGVRGAEPWFSDGTAAGTQFLFDINPSGASNPMNFTPLGDRVVFSADDGQHGHELWVSDGTPSGTQLVRDINPGSANSSPLELVAVGDRVYFVVLVDADQKTRTARTQLWTTDGTSGGTQLVWEAPGRSPGYAIRHLTLLGSQLLFQAPSGVDDKGFGTNLELYGLQLGGS